VQPRLSVGHGVAQVRVGGAEDARGQQPGVAGAADGHGRHRHSGWHLHDGEQGVHTVEVRQRDGHADHR
jgi:hypothetical protein